MIEIQKVLVAGGVPICLIACEIISCSTYFECFFLVSECCNQFLIHQDITSFDRTRLAVQYVAECNLLCASDTGAATFAEGVRSCHNADSTNCNVSADCNSNDEREPAADLISGSTICGCLRIGRTAAPVCGTGIRCIAFNPEDAADTA